MFPPVHMTSDAVLAITAELLKQALLLSLPLLLVTMLVGIAVSVLQVATQIQDPSIAFVPKFIAFIVAFGLLAPWMLARLKEFGIEMFAQLASGKWF
jgi:flagellar biosynthesis protein FliQ